ncbi:SCO2322 family protein [Actinacidiphila acididurans]|uniref:SCO2322 family protein n=1 Tax=Actinacidiphila acididurans TaxID=2784346 RepID=UPI003558EEF8
MTDDPTARRPRGDRQPRHLLLALTAALAFLLLGTAAPAYATGYRYWSYWLTATNGANGWTYAQTGPATHVPRDGDLEGWRFAVSRDAADQAAKPRGSWTFAAICGQTPAAAGHKRIALVIDPGTAADATGGEHVPAPRTACASVSGDASSADALAAVARPLRYDSAGILCAIGGYPAAGCGEQVATGSGSGGDSGGTRPHHGPEIGWFAAAGAIAVIGWAARWQSRRRRP